MRIHVGPNDLIERFQAFLVGAGILALMWVVLVVAALAR
jgi:hypothetical protein